MLSKLTKLINKFYSNWACTDFLQDHSALFYNINMMLCGAYRLTLYGHEHNTPQKACFCESAKFVNPPNIQKTNYGRLTRVDLYYSHANKIQPQQYIWLFQTFHFIKQMAANPAECTHDIWKQVLGPQVQVQTQAPKPQVRVRVQVLQTCTNTTRVQVQVPSRPTTCLHT